MIVIIALWQQNEFANAVLKPVGFAISLQLKPQCTLSVTCFDADNGVPSE
jgi:hypothetical protein